MCAMMQKLRVSSIDIEGCTMRARWRVVNRTGVAGKGNARSNIKRLPRSCLPDPPRDGEDLTVARGALFERRNVDYNCEVLRPKAFGAQDDRRWKARRELEIRITRQSLLDMLSGSRRRRRPSRSGPAEVRPAIRKSSRGRSTPDHAPRRRARSSSGRRWRPVR